MSRTALPRLARWRRLLMSFALAALAAPALAQYADLDRADWKEDAVPPPPAYSRLQAVGPSTSTSGSRRARPLPM